MELLKNINHWIWKGIFVMTGTVSDNIVFTICFAAAGAGVFLFILRKIVFHTDHVFFLPEFVITLSVAEMVDHLPLIHVRLSRALNMCSSIIFQSSSYLTAFTNASGIHPKSNTEIAEYLYYLKDRSAFEALEPQLLYEKLFSTMDSIASPWVTEQGMFWLAALLILFMCIKTWAVSPQRKYWILLFLQSVFLVWVCTLSRGALISASVLWILQELLQGILNTEASGNTTG